MGALNLLFAFLSLIFFVLIVVGLINPKWVKMQTRMRAFLIFFVGMIVSAILFDATMSDEEKAKQKAEIEAAAQKNEEDKLVTQQQKAEVKPKQVEQVEVKTEKSLGLTPEEFRTKLNEEIIQADISTIKPLKKFKLDGNTFTVEDLSNNGIGLVGKVNTKGEIESLLYIVSKADNSNDVAAIMLYPGLTAKILSPQIKTEKKTQALIDLMTKAAQGIDNAENFHEKTIDGISYYSTASKQLGMWVGFEGKE